MINQACASLKLIVIEKLEKYFKKSFMASVNTFVFPVNPTTRHGRIVLIVLINFF